MKSSKSVWLFSLFSGVCYSASIYCFFNPQPVLAQEIKLPEQANQDDTWTCGANSASRVLKYYGHNVSYPEVRGVAQHDHGIIPTKMCIGGGKTCIPFTKRCIEKPKRCFDTSQLKTGLEPEEVQKILARWEGGNAKLSTRASFEDLKARVREGKPVIVLKRVGSFKPAGGIIGTWPEMHWVTVHGLSESDRKIYYTDTATNSSVYPQSYDEFLSQWDWRIGDGLANETIWGKGVRPKTMIWVDRTVSSPIPSSSSSSSSITSTATSLCLDAKDYGRNGAGTPIQLWSCNGEAAQKWEQSNGSLVNGATGLCLDAKDYGRGGAGTPIQLWNCNGEAAQKWEQSNGSLVNGATGLCLDAKDYGRDGAGTPIQLWNCNGEAAQKWR